MVYNENLQSFHFRVSNATVVAYLLGTLNFDYEVKSLHIRQYQRQEQGMLGLAPELNAASLTNI